MSRLGLYTIQQLKHLPREIVDQILHDLTIYKVLQLATWSDPFVTEWILNHETYGRLFRSPADLTALGTRFQDYQQVKRSCGWRNDRYPFAVCPAISSNLRDFDYETLMNRILTYIVEGHRAALPFMELLSQYSPSPISSSILIIGTSSRPDLYKLWSAQETVKRLEAQQLNLLADFMETYPDMLRWANDPRGEASTIPLQHVIRRLRRDAKKVLNIEYMRVKGRICVRYAFRNGVLPILPRDWCLRLLLKSVRRFDGLISEKELSSENDIHAATNTLQGMSLAEMGGYESIESQRLQRRASTKLNTSVPSPEDIYPESAQKRDLRTIFAGLEHRYLKPAHAHSTVDQANRVRRVHISPKVLRTGSTFFALEPEKREQILEQYPPKMHVVSRDEFKYRFKDEAPFRVSSWGSPDPGWRFPDATEVASQPHDGREYEWLGAFLRAVEYLRDTKGKEGPVG